MAKDLSFVPKKDRVFREDASGERPFEFDAAVADAFDDMAARSIPGYRESLRTAVWLAVDHVAPVFRHGNVYDLGASTGALESALLDRPETKGWHFVAVDSSQEMAQRAEARLQAHPRAKSVTWRVEDIQHTPIEDAVMVVSHYCLQFVQPDAREDILARIFKGLRPGGYFLLSEKTSEAPHEVPYFRSRYEAFKRDEGYSQAEIDNKKKALQGVLIPWSAEQNEAALRRAGFERPVCLMKHWNFSTWIARKPAEDPL